MTRKEELLNLFNDIDEKKRTIVYRMIDDVVFLEEQLTELKKLPFIKVHPQNSQLQKSTPVAKQFKELLQQYNNCIKILCSVLKQGNGNEQDSPLRDYLKTVNQC